MMKLLQAVSVASNSPLANAGPAAIPHCQRPFNLRNQIDSLIPQGREVIKTRY
jgi:hypothetical protein